MTYVTAKKIKMIKYDKDTQITITNALLINQHTLFLFPQNYNSFSN
jgi:hypothetical protein